MNSTLFVAFGMNESNLDNPQNKAWNLSYVVNKIYEWKPSRDDKRVFSYNFFQKRPIT